MFEGLETPLAQLPGEEWPGADLSQVVQTLLEFWDQGSEGKVEKGQRRSSFSLDFKERVDAG